MSRVFKKPVFVASLIALFALALGVSAGSLTPPPGTVASTMHSLADIYTSIASSAFDSSSLTANRNGSLIQNLKYIEQNITWASSSGNIWNLNSGNVGIGTTTPITQLHVPGRVPSGAIGSVTLSPGSNNGPDGLYVQGRYAYVSNQTNSLLQIIDISNPSSPVVVGSVATGTAPYGVSVQGRYAYVVNFLADNLQVVDISNATNPVTVSTVGITHHSFSIYVQGRYAYIGSQAGMRIVDISNPSAPVSAGNIPSGNIGGVRVQGHYAYIIDRTLNLLKVIDVADPSNPRTVNSTAISSRPIALYVQGSYVYIQSMANALEIFHISNPTIPLSVGSVGVADGGSGEFFSTIFVQGRYAYIVSDGTNVLKIYDVSNPAAPTLVGSVSDAGAEGLTNVFVQGRYAYVNDYGSLGKFRVFDLGGSYIQQLEAGGIETGTLTLRNSLQVDESAEITGGLSVGQSLQLTGLFSVTVASLSDTVASTSRQSLVRITQGKGYLAGDAMLVNLAANTTADRFTGNFAKFQLAGSNRIILGAGGEILASGAAQFGSAGVPTSVSYSRFGTSATTHGNYISSPADLFLSADLEGRGSLSFAGPASISNTLWVSPGGFSGNVGIGTTSPNTGLVLNRGSLEIKTAHDTISAPTSWANIGTEAGLFLSYDSVNKNSRIAAYQSGTSMEDLFFHASSISFSTGPSGSPVERLRIDSGGNIGIGVNFAGPIDTKLEVGGTASISGVTKIFNTTAVYGTNDTITGPISNSTLTSGLSSMYDTTNNKAVIRSVLPSGNTFEPLYFQGNEFRWSTGAGSLIEKMALDVNGNLGIGATTPEQKLEVAGNVLASGSGNISLILNSTTEDDARFTIQTTAVANNTARLDILGSASQTFFSIASSGNVGIGTTNVDAKFEIVGGSGITVSSLASLSATSLNGGSVFNITVPASSSSNNPHGLMLVQSDTGTVIASWSMGGKLAIRGPLFSHGGGSSSCTGINAPTSGCVDYAESYFTDDPTLKAGDVVALDPHHPGSILRATGPSQALGVISSNPAALITGADLKTGIEALNNPPGTLPVALAGRVPVRITASVSAGDRLSAGPDGTAVRATTAGLTLGIALDNAQNGTVLMFVDNSYWAPDVEAISGEASSSGGSTSVTFGDRTWSFEYFFGLIVDAFKKLLGISFEQGKVGAERVEANTLCAGNTCVTEDQLRQLIEANGTRPPMPADSPSPSVLPNDVPTVSPSPEPTASPEPTPVETPAPAATETPVL